MGGVQVAVFERLELTEFIHINSHTSLGQDDAPWHRYLVRGNVVADKLAGQRNRSHAPAAVAMIALSQAAIEAGHDLLRTPTALAMWDPYRRGRCQEEARCDQTRPEALP